MFYLNSFSVTYSNVLPLLCYKHFYPLELNISSYFCLIKRHFISYMLLLLWIIFAFWISIDLFFCLQLITCLLLLIVPPTNDLLYLGASPSSRTGYKLLFFDTKKALKHKKSEEEALKFCCSVLKEIETIEVVTFKCCHPGVSSFSKTQHILLDSALLLLWQVGL